MQHIKMDTTRRSSKKNDAKKPFVTKASDNHIYETHVTGVNNPNAPTHYDLHDLFVTKQCI